jgi:hypothetical protein
MVHFDSVNEKSQVTKDRLYSEERKRGRALKTMKKVIVQQKTMKKKKGESNSIRQSETPSWLWGWRQGKSNLQSQAAKVTALQS